MRDFLVNLHSCSVLLRNKSKFLKFYKNGSIRFLCCDVGLYHPEMIFYYFLSDDFVVYRISADYLKKWNN